MEEGKKLLNFEGIDSNKIKRAFCIELCDIHEFKQDIQSVNPVATCIDICSKTCKCGELSVDLEGVKLEQVISQNDIKVNINHNVGMLNDVLSNLKKEVYAMREKLDKNVDSQVLYSSKVVDCSTQTTEIPDYNDHNNKGQMLSEFEYIKNCQTISHIQSLVCDNKSIKPKEFTHQTNRVTLDASINSSPRYSDDNRISNLKGFTQPCNFDGISSNHPKVTCPEIMRVHKITNQFQLELHADPKIVRRNGMRKQIGTVLLISTGQSIIYIYAYRNRSKGVYLAMANWLNKIKKRIFVPITSEIGSETN